MPGDSRDRSHACDRLNAEFERLDAASIVRWAVSTFDPDIAVSSSFGADSAVMLHLCAQVKPGEDPRSGRWAGFDKTECGLHKFEGGEGI